MTELGDSLKGELAAASGQASAVGDDPEQILHALDRYTNLIGTLDDARRDASRTARELIAKALQLNVDPRDLYGRPFSSTIVRGIAGELGLASAKPGPRPRTRPHGA